VGGLVCGVVWCGVVWCGVVSTRICDVCVMFLGDVICDVMCVCDVREEKNYKKTLAWLDKKRVRDVRVGTCEYVRY
jgi:hypothetical protein